MTALSQLKVKIFADGADKAGMLDMYARPYIKGLTTNPTLMRKSGIANYRAYAKEILSQINDKPCASRCLPTNSIKWSTKRWKLPVGRTTST